jgi:hypothetical protein
MQPATGIHRLDVTMSIKSLWTGIPRAARVYLSVVGALSVAAIAAVVTVAATNTPLLAAAPSPSPSASPGAGQVYCGRFTQHVASNLGKSQSQVQKAISDAIGQTIDDAVKNGDMTQSQANAIKARLSANNGGQACAGGLRGIPGIGRGGFGAFPRFAGGNQDEIARALGISTAELRQDLQSGKTVKDIAASKGMDEAAFRSKLASVAKADLDPQVKAGKLTQKQEDAILQRIQSGTLPLWDRPQPRLPERPQPGAAPTPMPTPTP